MVKEAGDGELTPIDDVGEEGVEGGAEDEGLLLIVRPSEGGLQQKYVTAHLLLYTYKQ